MDAVLCNRNSGMPFGSLELVCPSVWHEYSGTFGFLAKNQSVRLKGLERAVFEAGDMEV